MNLEYPMLFNVSNSCRGRVTHCGVLEFIAEEGIMYMPYWVSYPHAPPSSAPFSFPRAHACRRGSIVELVI